MNKPKVTKIKISEEEKELANSLINSSLMARDSKRRALRKIFGGCLCTSCGNLPTYRVIYDVGNAARIEGYCTTCYEKWKGKL